MFLDFGMMWVGAQPIQGMGGGVSVEQYTVTGQEECLQRGTAGDPVGQMRAHLVFVSDCAWSAARRCWMWCMRNCLIIGILRLPEQSLWRQVMFWGMGGGSMF